MAESKHTPGPWHLCNDGKCSCLTITCSGHPIAKAVCGPWGDDYPTIEIEGGSLDAKAVAVMKQITYGEIPKEIATANARLIAAAPDMLGALLVVEKHHSASPHIGLIRAAIAAATGSA